MDNSVLIGLDKFHYAKVTQDDSNGASYDTPVHVPNVQQANVNFNSEVATFFADDGPRIGYSQIGQVEVEIIVGDLPPEDYAFLIGADYSNGIVEYTTASSPPDVAIGFRAQKANGEYRYMWLLKGKFSVPEANHTTKQDSVEFQPQTITFVGTARQYDDKVFRRADADDESLPSGVIDNWFNNPDISQAPGAFTVTPSPADDSVDVAVDTTITWTFSNAIRDKYVDDDYFYVVDDSGDAVAGSLSIDSAKEVVTFTPDSNLANSTTYIAVVSNAVEDVYGQQIGQNTVTNFTTIA